jgi:hypothetical protein
VINLPDSQVSYSLLFKLWRSSFSFLLFFNTSGSFVLLVGIIKKNHDQRWIKIWKIKVCYHMYSIVPKASLMKQRLGTGVCKRHNICSGVCKRYTICLNNTFIFLLNLTSDSWHSFRSELYTKTFSNKFVFDTWIWRTEIASFFIKKKKGFFSFFHL